MDAGYEAHLRVGSVTVDGRDVALLRAVADHGSLNAAATALGRSYSRAHSRLGDLEEALGPLVDRERGGADGGGSRLTDEGRALLARFDRLAAALDGTATTERLVLDGTVLSREGRVAVVETPAGRVRALALTDDDRVQVSFRADAVTLHRPSGAPEGDETSARNRFEGTVTGVDRAEAVAGVTVDVGAGSPLVVRVTTDSLDRLGVEAGDAVVASFKATATRATRAYDT
ncbi:molybdenum-binding protein [Halobacteriales archaeon QH_10_67_22]|nr:MAG: molybdenum-binding protein [Halobacteriales archaeon QH_10_67_22]